MTDCKVETDIPDLFVDPEISNLDQSLQSIVLQQNSLEININETQSLIEEFQKTPEYILFHQRCKSISKKKKENGELTKQIEGIQSQIKNKKEILKLKEKTRSVLLKNGVWDVLSDVEKRWILVNWCMRSGEDEYNYFEKFVRFISFEYHKKDIPKVKNNTFLWIQQEILKVENVTGTFYTSSPRSIIAVDTKKVYDVICKKQNDDIAELKSMVDKYDIDFSCIFPYIQTSQEGHNAQLPSEILLKSIKNKTEVIENLIFDDIWYNEDYIDNDIKIRFVFQRSHNDIEKLLSYRPAEKVKNNDKVREWYQRIKTLKRLKRNIHPL
jgi:hypothetical protein